MQHVALPSHPSCRCPLIIPCRFKATIGDREVVTEVKRKAKAQQEYDDACDQGHSAVHLKQMPGAGLFCIEVGNLFAMEEAVVTFSYVRILNAVAGAVEFEHQATWVPPYIPPADTDPATGAPLPAVADANPSFAPAPAIGYSLSYTVVVRSSRGFASLDSPSDGLVVEQESLTERVARLAESVSDASRDFSLLIELPKLGGADSGDGASTGSLLLQEVVRNGQSKTVALATFVPRFAPPPPSGPKQQLIFVVDGSGSMGGSPIQQVRPAV
jgi:Ca-activated chloride channel family protein